MGYGDNRNGDDRWQGREGGGSGGGRWERERGSYGDWGKDRERGNPNRGSQGGDDQDRGFFERAGEQVRSWFGDDEDERGGRGRERGEGGQGGQSFGGGFGNQRGWGDDHFDRQYGSQQQQGRGQQRFDQSNPAGAAGSSFGGGQREDADRPLRSERGHERQGGAWGGGSGQHDPHYSQWRQRQIEQLDRDYDDYRREHQSKFEQDFGGWREKRQTQRQHLGRVSEHMTVVGSDGEHIGTVDKVRGDRIILTKSDANAGGVHHSIPCSWIESVDERVTVNKTAAEAMRQWESEEQNRALFERGDEGSEGPHILDRSFSNTYGDRDRDR